MPAAPTLDTSTPLSPDVSVAPLRRKRRHRSGPPVGREFRRFAAHGLEVRSAADGSDTITITGTPIVYDTAYSVCDMWGEFSETMHPGVVTNLLALTPDVRFLFNHDGMPLARTLSGTLSLADSLTGLQITATVDAGMSLANDLAIAIGRGDVNQMSCGFIVGLDQWNDDFTVRDIYRIEELFDVSAVTYPASPTTSIELSLRAMMAAPVASRARIRQAWKVAHEAREGKSISAANAALLQAALEAFHEADDADIPSIMASLKAIDSAVDAGQAALSAVLGVDNPDDDDPDADEKTSDADGTTGGVSDPAAPGIGDGTGSRSAFRQTKDFKGEDGNVIASEVTRSTAPTSVQERRDADRSFNDIEAAVRDAINKAYGTADSDWCDIWLEDCGDDWTVFHSWEPNPGVGLWRISYTLDDNGMATLGDDLAQVIEQTTYVVVPAERSAEDDAAEKRDADPAEGDAPVVEPTPVDAPAADTAPPVAPEASAAEPVVEGEQSRSVELELELLRMRHKQKRALVSV